MMLKELICCGWVLKVLNEFTHGKAEKVSNSDFRVLSDILIGMATGLKRDPIVILRIDGKELEEYVGSASFEMDMVVIFSEIAVSDGTNNRDLIVKALKKLGIDQGLPPTSDPWVMSNVMEPAFDNLRFNNNEPAVTQEMFLEELREVLVKIVECLKAQPVIVAHTENIYDGRAIKNLLANKFEKYKVLNAAIKSLPRDKHGRMSKEDLQQAVDSLASSAGLPPYGAVDEMDKVINEVFKMVGAEEEMLVTEEKFKELLLEILGCIMLQLEGNPVSISINSVVHEPLADPSSFLQTPTS